MDRAIVLVDIMNTVSTMNGYYSAAPELHRSPMQKVLGENNFGVRPGTRIRTYKVTPEEEEAELKAWEEDAASEEAELRALEEKYSTSASSVSESVSQSVKDMDI